MSRAAEKEVVACLGVGRMGRGIAVVFAYAGHEMVLVDIKPRESDAFDALAREVLDECRDILEMLSRLGLFELSGVDTILRRIRIVADADAEAALAGADFVFEGVPENLEVKKQVLARAEAAMRPDAIIASTTSTICVDDLSPAMARPGQFLNAHWLNPAFLVPLVEVCPGAKTLPEVTQRLTSFLESIGKVPVVCAPSPGYMIPRIQQVAMIEAARLVEEGVASAEDIEKAIRYGFSFRFSVLGMLEFIDWGGGDILFNACAYLSEARQDQRYAAPDIVKRNMEQGRIGLKTGQGFLDYTGRDIPAYREGRLGQMLDRLRQEGLARPPVL
ncbi:3-hydroxybutyryl-CoA dehydrogenase [Hoeflea sp. BAL378]|uniref:3-hydroxybutyryl-CoA dehydrogenase n=1 Tax=Hoeflea sp. BAL378 TaxID=1547437 RepID=UPI0009DEE38F|nr:3-hydroxybutyryl-CoA dehydrogenase [Hoeflea sp. BAL378]